ncbi:hypothetical protein F2Q69_00013681 [Brassica cretica]|uniref:Uncharacterized protein n=1 Tax=Brassica cretica TaxID=69181 RepID=A0A8S9R772_BRACR|nr:hypothetical protein F2Q69_00013681 [Brassica cretica]
MLHPKLFDQGSLNVFGWRREKSVERIFSVWNFSLERENHRKEEDSISYISIVNRLGPLSGQFRSDHTEVMEEMQKANEIESEIMLNHWKSRLLIRALQENSGILTDILTENEIVGIYRGTVPSEYSEERVPRNIPRKMSLGIIRGNSSVGIFLSIDVYMSKTHRSMNVRGNIPTKFSLGIFRGHFRQNNGPRNFLGNLFPRNSVGKFRGISDERRNSEELFPTTYFVGMSSE